MRLFINNKNINSLRVPLFVALLTLWSLTAFSAGLSVDDKSEGVADCLGCHQSSSNNTVHAIWQTKHGSISPNSNKTCVNCHGKSNAHAEVPTKHSPSVSFGPKWISEVTGRNNSCLNCHQKKQGINWLGSAHNEEDLACDSCHKSHNQIDIALNEKTQHQACFQCHTDVQSQAHMRSRHPILEGQTACADCHDPHGSLTEYSLKAPTLNDTCFQCHTEKRGPVLFEHAPVAEDCSICHNSHGSVNENLLSTRTPFLCQQCHSVAFHPSQQIDASILPNRDSSPYGLAKNCLSCHSSIHGSNHPSGFRLTR